MEIVRHLSCRVHPTFVILSRTECSEGSQALHKIGILHFAIATFRMTFAKLGYTLSCPGTAETVSHFIKGLLLICFSLPLKQINRVITVYFSLMKLTTLSTANFIAVSKK